MTDLLAEIERFCQTHGVSESGFGWLALGDKPFVRQVREGRRCWPETEAKVRAFMASYKREAA